jgi:pimeloyl-ACP methyl ester carboxylesterase
MNQLTSEDHPPSNRGLVLLADGVGGLDFCTCSMAWVIRRSANPLTFQPIAWGHGKGRWYADLSDQRNRDAHARIAAEQIRQARASQPGAPVFLIGKSGGSGVIIKTLEFLENPLVDRVVLLAPAVSPRYNLSRALESVRTELIVFWSPLDVFILGAGTSVFGTIDRKNGVSAGLVGFQTPLSISTSQEITFVYDRLRQIRWSPRMAATGNFGGHFGPDSPFFLRRYVLPLLTIELPKAS